MRNKLKISFLGLLIFTSGCYGETPAFLDETNSRKQAEAVVEETEQLENSTEQFQKLENPDKALPEIPEFQTPELSNLSEQNLPDSEK